MNWMNMRLGKKAYTLGALTDAGMPADVARTMLADGRNAVPERALLSTEPGTRKRTPQPTRDYVWGPDAMTLLAGVRERAGKES